MVRPSRVMRQSCSCRCKRRNSKLQPEAGSEQKASAKVAEYTGKAVSSCAGVLLRVLTFFAKSAKAVY